VLRLRISGTVPPLSHMGSSRRHRLFFWLFELTKLKVTALVMLIVRGGG